MKVRINPQKLYALIVAYMLSFLALLNLSNAILNRIGLQTVLDTVMIYGLMLILICLGMLVSILEGKAIRLDDLILLVFFVASFLISGLYHPQIKRYLFTSWMDYAKNPIYVTFLYSIPGFYFTRRLHNYSDFRKIMAVFSYAVVCMSAIVYFAAKESAAMQYMTFSYNMLTQLLFLCMNPSQNRKWLHNSIVAIGMFVFILGGARGAMISMVLALVLWFYFKNEGSRKIVIACCVMIAVGVLFSFLKNYIFLLIGEVLDLLSINSRTFRYLLRGELLNDSHRMKLYEKTITNTGVLGAGIMSDRKLLNSYPHNLFLELWYQHGWILGSVLVVTICACILIALIKKKRPELPFVVLMLPCGFMKLMLTGSYLHQEPAFYVLLGFCLNSILRGSRYANTTHQYRLRGGQYR